MSEENRPDDEADRALEDIHREALRQAAREAYGTVGQARAERDPTADEVERERYAHHRDDKIPLETLRTRAGRKANANRPSRGRGL